MNIEDFCANENEERLHLRKPFNIEGKTVATDGVTIVFIKQDEKYGTADFPITASISAMLNEINQCKAVDGFNLMPDIVYPETCECFACKGSGYEEEKVSCEECHGSGNITFSNEHNEYECHCINCDGDGIKYTGNNSNVKCTHCGGLGRLYVTLSAIEIDGVEFNPFFIDKLVKNISNLKVKVIKGVIKGNKMLFIGDGDICGIIMGFKFK